MRLASKITIYKKIQISLLLVTLFNFFIGCYSYNTVTISEFKEIQEEPKEIIIKTVDGQMYNFKNSIYYIGYDTHYIKEKIIADEKWIVFDGKIANDKITEIEFYSPENDWTYRFSVDEFQRLESAEEQPDEIFVFTKDSTKYYFAKGRYELMKDTLYGVGNSLFEEREETIFTEISISDIKTIWVLEPEIAGTIVLIVIGIGIAFIIVVGISLSGSNWFDWPSDWSDWD